jgi:putative transcriptional regulator
MIEPGPGILLIADPFLQDPNFQRTVVFLCEHEHLGSLGFVINKPYPLELNQVLHNIEDLKLTIYNGGPVNRETLHFLHQYPELIPNSHSLGGGIYWGGDFSNALHHLENGKISPKKIKFFIGYSGWGEGQLADELKEKSWLTVKANRNIVFNTASPDIWKNALTLLGGEFGRMANYPTDPRLN